MKLVIDNYTYQRPNFSFITDTDFDKAKDECRRILIRRAKARNLPISYKALALSLVQIYYPFDDDPVMHALACIVGEISIEEFAQHRPMISALVVNLDTQRPGKGFFNLARELHCNVVDEDTFWSNELNRIYSQEY